MNIKEVRIMKKRSLTNLDGVGLKMGIMEVRIMKKRNLTNLDGVGVRDAEWRAPPRSPFPDLNFFIFFAFFLQFL